MTKDDEIAWLMHRLDSTTQAFKHQHQRAIDAERQLMLLRGQVAGRHIITDAELKTIVALLRCDKRLISMSSDDTVKRLRKMLADAGIEC